MTDMTVHQMMGCDDFAAHLADYLEGDAPEAVREAMNAHAATCAGCAELLADLERLPQMAAALPPLEPSRDLWAGIAERIDARVLPLESPRAARPVSSRRGWVRPAAAAAALMIVTAGVTYQLTKASVTRSPAVASTPGARNDLPRQVALAVPPVRVTTADSSSTTPAQRSSSASGATPAVRLASSGRSGGERAPLTSVGGSPAVSSGVRLVGNDPLKSAEPVYDREIAKLRVIVRERRSQLDPTTIAVLEQSIAVIDSAIAQSRAALAKDPASGFLAGQLNYSLEMKVELLRTAALLPSRT
jgi:hypothetical protein